MSKAESDRLTEALREAGPGIYSPEVQAQVDALLGVGEEPISVEFRQRLIAAAQRGLRANREAATRERLQASCRCTHQRVQHRHDGCGELIELATGAIVNCPCRRFSAATS